MSSIPTASADVAVARRLYEAFGARDLAAVTATLDPQVRVVQGGDLPWSGTYSGHEGAAAFLGALLAHVDSHLEIGEIYASGDAVVQVGRTRGVAHGTGRRFDAAEVHVLRMRGGLVVSFEAFVDVEEFRAALGSS